jgi:hypothetical protein
MLRRALVLSLALTVGACGDDGSSSDEDDAGGSGGAATTAGAGAGSGDPCGHVGDPEPGPVVGITAAHNAARCGVASPTPLPMLSWSADIAAEAQAWADSLAAQNCSLSHSSSPYGENLYGGSGGPQEVVDLWMAEASCYGGGAFPDSCSCTCGHFSQVVWRNTTRLGCGVGSCPGGGRVWVCNYDPPGNYVGQMPY